MRHLFVAAVAGVLGAIPAGAQDLTDQVSQVERGVVRATYQTRPGTCGTRDNIQLVTQDVHRGRWNDEPCIEGPAFLQLSVRNGRVVESHVRVGRASWPAASGPITDVGLVPAPAAARDLLRLAESASADSGEDLVFAAVLADSIELAAPLLRLARSSAPTTDTRKAAVFWLSHGTDAEVAEELEVLAMDEGLPMDVREAAVFGLSQESDHGGAAALKRIAQIGAPTDLRENAVFWLGQTDAPDIVAFLEALARESDALGENAVFALSQHDSPEAHAALEALVVDRSVATERRENAIFWLGQGGERETVSFLAAVYPHLEIEDLREKVIFSMAQVGTETAIDWLMALAGDAAEPVALRKNALFWVGQTGGAEGRLLEAYDGVQDRELKQQLIFVYSQMDDADALAKLMDIAKTERDHDLRENAVFWLGQSDDPAALAYLEDLITN
jgi:HEAT repeat protein